MARGEINFQIFCFLSLLLIGKSLSTQRVFDQMLVSLKNIENLLRESSQPSLYITSSIARNEMVNSPQHRRSQDFIVNAESLDNDDIREHLKRHPQSSRNPNWGSPRSSIDANVNSNSNINQFQPGNEDDFESGKPVLRRSLRLKEKPRILGRPRTDNSNSNANINVNSNLNTVEKNPVAVESRPKSSSSNSGISYGIGDRSLFNRGKDVNRNTNMNSNTNINANSLYSMDDEGDGEMGERR